MNQQTVTTDIIKQIIEVTLQLDKDAFFLPLGVLSGNTFGKHVRHIIEFYKCLLQGYEYGIVDYDAREHDALLETNKIKAIDELNQILHSISMLEDKPMKLKVDYSGNGIAEHIETSFNRELVYNLEHAIHHMAILKIAVESSFKNIKLPENFGVAYSTVRYHNNQCAQ